jgi:hypothetical protein
MAESRDYTQCMYERDGEERGRNKREIQKKGIKRRV